MFDSWPNCATWDCRHRVSVGSMDSTANRLDGHVTEVLNELVLGKLRTFGVSSGENERNILCRGETSDVVAGLILMSGKLC